MQPYFHKYHGWNRAGEAEQTIVLLCGLALVVVVAVLLRDRRRRRPRSPLSPLAWRLTRAFRALAVLLGAWGALVWLDLATGRWGLAEKLKYGFDLALAGPVIEPLAFVLHSLTPALHPLFVVLLWHFAPVLALRCVRGEQVWTAVVARWLGWATTCWAAYLGTLLGWAESIDRLEPAFRDKNWIALPDVNWGVLPLVRIAVLATFALGFLLLAPPILRTAIPRATDD